MAKSSSYWYWWISPRNFTSHENKNLIHFLRMNPLWTSEVNRAQGNWSQYGFIFLTSFHSIRVSLNGIPLTLQQIVFPHLTKMFTLERKVGSGTISIQVMHFLQRSWNWLNGKMVHYSSSSIIQTQQTANMPLQGKLTDSLPVISSPRIHQFPL